MTADRYEFNRVTFGMPAQAFRVTAFISAEERLPVVTEFVLRLLHTMGEVTLAGLRDYFGFTESECLAVVEALDAQGYVQLVEERLSLSEQMKAKFEATPEECPWVAKLKKRTDVVTFDLLTFSPLGRLDIRFAPDNWVKLHVEDEVVGSSVARAREAYRTSFANIERAESRRKGQERERSFGVHSIEHVEAQRPSFVPLSTSLALDASAQLSCRLPDTFESSAPSGLIESVHERMNDKLNAAAVAGTGELDEFIDLFDLNFLREYVAGERVDFSAYADAVKSGKHEMTGVLPIFGAAYLQANLEKLAMLVHSAREARAFSSLGWLAPDYGLWGRGDDFRAAVSSLRNALRSHAKGDDLFVFDYAAERQEIPTRAKYANTGVTELHLVRPGRNLKAKCLPSLELLLYPTAFCCALLHMPLQPGSSVRVPVGFASALPRHIRTVHSLIWSQLAGERYAGRWTPVRDKETVKSAAVRPIEDACAFLHYSDFDPAARKILALKQSRENSQ
jgi:hypothetical protein